MKHRCVVLLAISLAGPAAPLLAQRPLTLNVAGGVAVPMGQFADGAELGWNALVSFGLSSLMLPQGLRLDVAHSRFSPKGGGGTDQGITSGTLNLTYRLPMTNSALSPYLITGAGAYRFECFGDIDCGSDTRFGWNAGLGSKWVGLGLRGFIEARFNAVNAEGGNARWVPVTLGLTF